MTGHLIEEAEHAPAFVQPTIAGARKKGSEFVVIVCDTFNDYQALGFDGSATTLPECDYPVYCQDENELRDALEQYDGKEMQEIKRIYRVREKVAT